MSASAVVIARYGSLTQELDHFTTFFHTGRLYCIAVVSVLARLLTAGVGGCCNAEYM